MKRVIFLFIFSTLLLKASCNFFDVTYSNLPWSYNINNQELIIGNGSYLRGGCSNYNFYFKFKIKDKSYIDYFKSVYVAYDDWVRIEFNGHRLYSGPNGDYWDKCEGHFNQGFSCWCENSITPSANINMDLTPYLRYGDKENVIHIKLMAGGSWGKIKVIFKLKGWQKKETLPYCPPEYRLENGECVYEKTYYKYLCEGNNYYGNPYKPVVEQGDNPNPPKNNCKALSYKCVPAPDRKCVQVNNQWQCSPYPCFGEDGGDYKVENDDTPVGINDKNNNGWDSSGQCLGQIYIFNGKDNRCRSDDVAGGLTGGGCCDKDKVFLGLIPCKEEEKLLAKKRENGLCHYVGEYCSKKLNLLVGDVCIQHKKTYCCFNSKLARIINEQGREQLGISWGSAKSPDCRGFKPDEFAKLDFSKMDLSEFYSQISNSISNSVMQNINNYIKENIERQLNSLK